LLRAGLIPRQREEDALPVYVRFELSKTAPPLGEQVKLAICAAADEAEMSGPRPREDETLWAYLHRADGWFWSKGHRITMPFIVLDQFEEVLAGSDSDHLQRDAFLAELADLTEDRTPAALRRQFDEDPSRSQWYVPTRHHYKIVVCTRDDSEGELDRVRDLVSPKLLQNGYRLEPLRGDQALNAVVGPGAGFVEADVAEEIVRKAADGSTGARSLRDLSVQPAALSVLCLRANEARIRRGGEQITKEVVDEFGPKVLLEFYEDSLRGSVRDNGGLGQGFRVRAAHRKLERNLLADGGARRSTTPDEICSRWGLGPVAVEGLIDRQVLRRTDRGVGTGRVELSHDVMIEPVRHWGRDLATFLWGAATWLFPAADSALAHADGLLAAAGELAGCSAVAVAEPSTDRFEVLVCESRTELGTLVRISREATASEELSTLYEEELWQAAQGAFERNRAEIDGLLRTELSETD
jgi:hypothetical protein